MSFPTLRVRALIVSDAHVLLSRLLSRPVSFLPGGRVDPGETLEDALRREVKEECEADAEAIEYLGAVEHRWVEVRRPVHDLNHFFLVSCRTLTPSDTPRCNDAAVEMYWAPIERIGLEPIKPESVKRLLRGWLEGDRSIWWAYEHEA